MGIHHIGDPVIAGTDLGKAVFHSPLGGIQHDTARKLMRTDRHDVNARSTVP